VIFVVTWFAGLFYLPRLFVYHSTIVDAAGAARFKIMERRLFAMMTIGGTLALIFGVAMVALSPALLSMTWLRVKLGLVALLIVYHIACFRLLRLFSEDRNTHSETWYRGFNELPTVLLIAIVVLAVVKPF
jgi:protoporphyrinogen IX oxidase